MSTVTSRWTARRRKLVEGLRDAQADVRYLARRAGSARGKQLLDEAVARRGLLRSRIAEADRVLDRHAVVSDVSDAGLSLIAGFEGFRSRPYTDVAGVWTIGYGETKGIGPRTKPWTRAHALQRLRARVRADYLAPVLKLTESVGLQLKQNEADALASLVYNLGPGVLGRDSTLGKAIRAKDRKRIADAFLLYDKARDAATGRTVRWPGLTRRRRAERALFLKR